MMLKKSPRQGNDTQPAAVETAESYKNKSFKLLMVTTERRLTCTQRESS